MSGLFNQAFSKEEQKVPDEVIEELNQELPKGYRYAWNDQLGHLIIEPTDEKVPRDFNVVVDRKENNIPMNISDDQVMEYIYRNQLAVKATKVSVNGKSGKTNVMEDPLTHENDENKEMICIYPQPFPEAKLIEFETSDGTKISIKLKRQKYDSMDHILLENEDFPALKIRWIISEKQSDDDKVTGSLTVSASPFKAKSVDDAIISLKILSAFGNGTLLIGGHPLGAKPEKLSISQDDIQNKMEGWLVFKKLETILNVKFDPSAGLTDDQLNVVPRLETSFIYGKEEIIDAPLSHFHLNDPHFDDFDKNEGVSVEENENRLSEFYEKRFKSGEKVSLTYLQDQEFEIMGAHFHLVQSVLLLDIVVEKFIKDDSGIDLYVSNIRDSECPWKMVRKLALNEEDAQKDMDELLKKYGLETEN